MQPKKASQRSTMFSIPDGMGLFEEAVSGTGSPLDAPEMAELAKITGTRDRQTKKKK